MKDHVSIDTADSALASLFSVAALAQALVAKGLLDAAEIDVVFSSAGAACQRNGSESARQLIELLFPRPTELEADDDPEE